MQNMQFRQASLFNTLLLPLFFASSLAVAESHLWDIDEVFSNSDGSLQYIELFTTAPSQGVLNGIALTSSGPDAGSVQFTFDSDISADTANRSLLIATQRFALLTGLEPDFILPDGFVPVGGGTIDFDNGIDTVVYTREQLPQNGVQSMDGDGLPQDASPTRFDGLSTSLPEQANPFTVFDAATGVLNIPVLDAPGIGVANVNFDVDLGALTFTLLDFFLYGAGVSAGDLPVEFFNGSVLYIPQLLHAGDVYEANLNILGDDPIVFGEPEVLGVAPLPDDPDPEPEPDPLQESINRGQAIFATQCATCHGSSGQGGFGGPSLQTTPFNTFDLLRAEIDSSMPRGNASACIDSDTSTCATDAANYVLHVIQN